MALAGADHKAVLLGNLAGTVLELGAGHGANFPFLPAGVCWIGLEPDTSRREELAQAAAAYDRDAVILAAHAEAIPLEDASVDAVLATMVLCSVREPRRVLEEVRRVLRPRGRFVFLEHVAAARGSWLRGAQQLVAPFSRLLDHGCDPARDTEATIAQAGFAHLELQRFTAPGPLGVQIPHIAGHART